MTNTTDQIPPLSDATRAAVANVVDYQIEREYGRDVAAEIQGATTLALAGLRFDLRERFMSINGSDNGLDGYARSTLRILVRDGLVERECQCRRMHPDGRAHGHVYTCHVHYESDVPPIDGVLLCGGCHIAEYQTRQGDQ